MGVRLGFGASSHAMEVMQVANVDKVKLHYQKVVHHQMFSESNSIISFRSFDIEKVGMGMCIAFTWFED